MSPRGRPRRSRHAARWLLASALPASALLAGCHEPGASHARAQDSASAGASGEVDEAARRIWQTAHALPPATPAAERARALAPIADGQGPLAPWARLRQATWLLEADPAAALERLSTLLARAEGAPTPRAPAAVEAGWAGEPDAVLLAARALRAIGRRADAEALLRGAVAAGPERPARLPLTAELAETLDATDDDASRREAAARLRWVTARGIGREGHAAWLARLEAIAEALPEAEAQAARRGTIDDRFAEAEGLLRAFRHEDAERAFAALATELGGSERPGWCAAELGRGRALVRRRAREEGARALGAAADRCEAPEIRAQARYLAASALLALGRHADAAAEAARVPAEAPGDRLADDALVLAGVAMERAGDPTAAGAFFARAARETPEGDLVPEARFQLAWLAREAGRLDEALATLDEALARDPLPRAEDLRGRAAYWRARVLAALGRRPEANAEYAALFRRWPLSYYAQQARARLLDAGDPLASALLDELREVTPYAPAPLHARPELAAPAFRRAAALLAVNEVVLAERELEATGALGEGADRDLLWHVAYRFDGAGAHDRSSRLVRRRLSSFVGTPPVGAARALWRLAYPDAFAPLLDTVAEHEGIPAPLLRAIVREESGFDARAESVAHAYGLAQLILPTATRMGRELGMTPTRELLFEPGSNLRLGARYLAFLRRRFARNPAVVPAAYNAGETAVDRWLAARGDRPLDEWIELIPYEETRGYTRRVLQSFGVYSWFADGTLPDLRAALTAGDEAPGRGEGPHTGGSTAARDQGPRTGGSAPARDQGPRAGGGASAAGEPQRPPDASNVR